MPVSQAMRRCPDLIRLPVDMAHYRERSAEVMKLVGELGVPTEPASLDEIYLDLSSVPDPVARMSALVRRIREQLSLTASVGIGPNKLVAKVASDAEKPAGFVVLTREQAAERFAGEPPRLIPGIGPKTAERLDALGVKTIGDLQRYPVDELVRRFGEHHGRGIHDSAHFRSDSRVARRELKSRSVEATFDFDLADHAELERILGEQSERLAAELAERKIAGRTIAIKVRLDDWTTYTRAKTIDHRTADVETIRSVATALLRANAPERPVRLIGVRVGGFEERERKAAPPDETGEALTLLPAA